MPTSTGNNFPARFDMTHASRAYLPVRHNIGTPSSSPARPTRTSSKQSESIRGSPQAPSRQTGSHNRSRSPHERAGRSTGDDTATDQAYNAIDIDMSLDLRTDLVYQENMPDQCHVYQVSLSKRSRADVSLKNLPHSELKRVAWCHGRLSTAVDQSRGVGYLHEKGDTSGSGASYALGAHAEAFRQRGTQAKGETGHHGFRRSGCAGRETGHS